MSTLDALGLRRSQSALDAKGEVPKGLLESGLPSLSSRPRLLTASSRVKPVRSRRNSSAGGSMCCTYSVGDA